MTAWNAGGRASGQATSTAPSDCRSVISPSILPDPVAPDRSVLPRSNNAEGAAVGFASCLFQIGLDHHLDEPLEIDFGLPAEPLAGLGRIAQQHVDFRRAGVFGIEVDKVAIVEIDQRE